MSDIEKLRSFIPAENKKIMSWLKFLNDGQLEEVTQQLKQGETNADVIRFVQNTYKLKREHSIIQMLPELIKYRTRALNDADLISLEIEQGNPVAKEIAAKIQRLSSEVDAMGRLGWLIDTQTQRVARLMERENKSLPLDMTTENIKVLGKLLTDFIDKQVAMGYGRNTTMLKLEVQQKFDTLLETAGEQEANMIDVASRFLNNLEQKAILIGETPGERE